MQISDAIDNTISSTILQIREKNNRVEFDSIYNETIKTIDFEGFPWRQNPCTY